MVLAFALCLTAALAVGGCDGSPGGIVDPVDPPPPADTSPPVFVSMADTIYVKSTPTLIRGRVIDDVAVARLFFRVGTGPEQQVAITSATTVDFEVTVDVAPPAMIRFRAEDAAGNVTAIEVRVENPPFRYRVIVLGSLAGEETIPTSINSHGQVVGDSRVGGIWRAFRWEHGVMTALDTLATVPAASDPAGTRARGISDTGIIAGSHQRHAVIWTAGTPRRLTVKEDDPQFHAYATAVNNAGTVVGSWYHSGSSREAAAFVVSGDSVKTFEYGWARVNPEPRAINSHGVTVGVTFESEFSTASRPFRHEQGSVQYVMGAGWPGGLPFAINDRGQIAGIYTPQATPHVYPTAFIWDSGNVTSIGVLSPLWTSLGHGMNNLGEMVGVGYDPSRAGTETAFLWRDRSLWKLSDLVVGNWLIEQATAINDHSQITAVARDPASGAMHAVLLVLEP
jgi:probable HAF family extracellular repeat protein